VHTIAYADDFIVTGDGKELLETKILPEVRRFMRERGLTLSEEKTVITHINDGFNFLGHNIRKYKGKLLIKPSKENIKRFLDNIRELVKKHPMVKQETLIGMLNPKIRGWANYHRHSVAKGTFAYVDHQIFGVLQSWCKRRHPKRNKRWINAKYFHQKDTRKWVFATKTEEGELLELLKASDTKIVRHVKIRKGANPYDPEWYLYFEEREGNKMFGSMSGRKMLKEMWMKQKGRCLVCRDVINQESGWRVHTDGNGKKVLVHPNCHMRLHSNEPISCTG
jgi:RNA-directed DNA polymerase